MTRKDIMQIINDISGLSDKEKMEVAREIILSEALDTGIDAINNVCTDLSNVIENCYK